MYLSLYKFVHMDICAVCLQVSFKDVGFRYPTRPDIVALEGVSLELAPGRLTAMVGLSGSGKSTMVALLQRLYDPLQGQVGALQHPCLKP